MLECDFCGKELDPAAVPKELTRQTLRFRCVSIDAPHQDVPVIYYFCSPDCKQQFILSGKTKHWCVVCDKLIKEPQDDLSYRTRIDRPLLWDTSHFEHIHVTYYFCSPECREKFFAPKEGPPSFSKE